MKVLFLMTGSIASFKACGVISKLVQAGHEVQVAASPAALKFIGEPTLEGLSRRPVVSDLWAQGGAMDHIHWVRWADVIAVIPASAHYINRIAQGVGEDLLSTFFLAHDFKKPFLLAPAMNTSMYLHPVTQASLTKLKSFGVQVLESASGVLACGEQGYGRLLEVDLLVEEILKVGPAKSVSSGSTPSAAEPGAKRPKPAAKVLITAGGTLEPIDEIRVIGNRSRGYTGVGLAEHLVDLGFDVTLLLAQSATPPKVSTHLRRFETFDDLRTLLREELQDSSYQAVVHLAAVSDYRVLRVVANGQTVSSNKIPSGESLAIELQPNPKLIDQIRSWSRNPNLFLVGFKLTAGAGPEAAREAVEKLIHRSKADWVVQNDWIQVREGVRHPFQIWDSKLQLKVTGEHRNQIYQALGQEIARRTL